MSRTQFCYAMLLIAAISAKPAYAAFTGFYQLIPSGGDGTLRGGFVTLPAGAPSLVVDLPSTAKSTDNFHTIAVDGRASIYAGDERNFGVFAAASAVANPGAWTAQLFGMQTRAHISVIDDMRLTGNLSNAHFIIMKAFWYVSGSLSAIPSGIYSSQIPAANPDYVNAGADAVLEISGAGVGLGPYGTGFNGVDVWGHSTHYMNSEVTVVPNIDLPPPTILPLTLIFENNIFAHYVLNVELTTTASVKDFDTTNFLGGSSTAIAEFGHTFTWGGVTSVTDMETGQPINDWTLTSASGIDWAHPFPVPEPSCLLCAVPAAFAFGAMRKRSS